MKKIKYEALSDLFDAISKKEELYLPINNDGKADFGLYYEGAPFDLNVLKTVKSAKDIFFPQSETLYTCHEDGGKISIQPEKLMDRPFVVFGVRPCDVKGMEVLDKVFLSEPVDTFYAKRRENGIIISLACSKPSESCFCTLFGITPYEPKADVASYIIDKEVYFKANTEKGEKLLLELSDLLEDADDKKVEEEKEKIKAILDRLPYKDLSLGNFGKCPDKEKFESPLWEKLYSGCIACGTCTFSCPTCQCYDIKDYDTGKGGIKRYRCWDSCMYSDFTMMAHGNNRTSQMQRFRQRFMHKLQYFPVNNDGMYSCVGCGRCVDLCPSNLNIVKVIKAFSEGGEKNE